MWVVELATSDISWVEGKYFHSWVEGPDVFIDFSLVEPPSGHPNWSINMESGTEQAFYLHLRISVKIACIECFHYLIGGGHRWVATISHLLSHLVDTQIAQSTRIQVTSNPAFYPQLRISRQRGSIKSRVWPPPPKFDLWRWRMTSVTTSTAKIWRTLLSISQQCLHL